MRTNFGRVITALFRVIECRTPSTDTCTHMHETTGTAANRSDERNITRMEVLHGVVVVAKVCDTGWRGLPGGGGERRRSRRGGDARPGGR